MSASNFRMFGKIKKFDEKLYNKYDIPARNIVKEKLGEFVEDNPDIYAEDMILKIPECKYNFLELQVCATWTGQYYPHVKPYVYERKKKFNETTLFMIFSRDMSRALIFDQKSLCDKPRRLKKYSREYVYEVPNNQTIQFITEELSCDMIKLYN